MPRPNAMLIRVLIAALVSAACLSCLKKKNSQKISRPKPSSQLDAQSKPQALPPPKQTRNVGEHTLPVIAPPSAQGPELTPPGQEQKSHYLKVKICSTDKIADCTEISLKNKNKEIPSYSNRHSIFLTTCSWADDSCNPYQFIDQSLQPTELPPSSQELSALLIDSFAVGEKLAAKGMQVKAFAIEANKAKGCLFSESQKDLLDMFSTSDNPGDINLLLTDMQSENFASVLQNQDPDAKDETFLKEHAILISLLGSAAGLAAVLYQFKSNLSEVSDWHSYLEDQRRIIAKGPNGLDTEINLIRSEEFGGQMIPKHTDKLKKRYGLPGESTFDFLKRNQLLFLEDSYNKQIVTKVDADGIRRAVPVDFFSQGLTLDTDKGYFITKDGKPFYPKRTVLANTYHDGKHTPKLGELEIPKDGKLESMDWNSKSYLDDIGLGRYKNDPNYNYAFFKKHGIRNQARALMVGKIGISLAFSAVLLGLLIQQERGYVEPELVDSFSFSSLLFTSLITLGMASSDFYAAHNWKRFVREQRQVVIGGKQYQLVRSKAHNGQLVPKEFKHLSYDELAEKKMLFMDDYNKTVVYNGSEPRFIDLRQQNLTYANHKYYKLDAEGGLAGEFLPARKKRITHDGLGEIEFAENGQLKQALGIRKADYRNQLEIYRNPYDATWRSKLDVNFRGTYRKARILYGSSKVLLSAGILAVAAATHQPVVSKELNLTESDRCKNLRQEFMTHLEELRALQFQLMSLNLKILQKL